MNILLLAMPDIVYTYPDSVITTPNLGLSSIAGNLDKRHNVKIADLVVRRKNVKEAVLEALNKTQPGMVGLSAMTFQYDTALRIARLIRDLFPHIKIALGGYHATLMYKEIADSKDAEFFDFIFRGEAEVSFNETVDKLEVGDDLRGVHGLSFKKNGKFIHNKKRELENLDKIKPPVRNLRLWNKCNIFSVPFDLVESSRGCLNSCNFCNMRMMYGKTFRTYEISRVIKDIENAKRSGIRLMFFTDDNITLDVPRYEALCDEIVTHGLNDIVYAVQASSAGIASSERLAQKMARAGFRVVFLGMENTSKKNLQELQKGDIVDKSRQAVKLLHDNDILVAAGLIVGNPDDDYESIKETLKFAGDLKADFDGSQFLVPYPKTVIRKKLLAKGLITNPDDFSRYSGAFANTKTKYLSDKELEFIKFKLTNKYLRKTEIGAVKALLKHKKTALKLLIGGLKLIPEMIGILINGKIKKLFLSEQKLYNQNRQHNLNLNKFNI